MENSYSKEAAGSLGIELPGQRALASPILVRAFDEQCCFTNDSILNMDYPCCASDGWRKKCCEGEVSLRNFTVMGNEGALLYDMRDCSDMRKNESGIPRLTAFGVRAQQPPAVPYLVPAHLMQQGCAYGLLVFVPDAPALASAAALALPADPAPCPGPRAPSRSPDPLGVPLPLGPGARGDVMFVFPRRLVVGDVSVIHPAAASFAVGAGRAPGFAAAARVV
jgi:hypothetical protein